ncbi:conserved protein of unknown function [Candidatus Filomicrobium marinum]|uniref:DUF3800 domain-containing protein n=1 Tax=Candidatus Filomicrobium marinum TaxID=1608628 RepID=A0A0D6JCA6_9HYPH|nr:DUF3800 domain-containing protein [Candidatus Filomicrobium marinum]CFX09501.1 conserved protein of unknown function [Candidatus Filomicrobium marinum]CPR16972.1 conserved protein of unknown function [Candidatus Filomicrobium marinum]
MSHSFIAYIDESGDDGLCKFRQPGGKGGASHWLCICACIVRATHRLEAVRWRDEIREKTRKKTKGRAIHFADFNHSQKRAACQLIYRKPLRFIAAISNKTTIEPGTFSQKNQLYFYVTRYAIERISWFCRDNRALVPEGNGQVKIVFSRRGGLSYDDFKMYMSRLKDDENNNRVHWPVIDIASIDAQDHSRDAGLQLADCGAAAIAAAFEPDLYGNVEAQYLHTIREMIYCRSGNYLSYGLKLLPGVDRMELTAQQGASLKPFK